MFTRQVLRDYDACGNKNVMNSRESMTNGKGSWISGRRCARVGLAIPPRMDGLAQAASDYRSG
jgi:hypothetical protein